MAAIRIVTAAFVALLMCWSWTAAADVAVPALTGRVVDQTATLTPDQIASLDQTLKAFEQRKGTQIAVLIVPTTEPESIEQFSIRVAEAWKIGRKKIDDGALLVVAKNDRRLRIEVGYGLEGALTDVTARRIIDEIITPKFRSGDFAGGISDGVARMIAVADGEALPPPERSQRAPATLDNIETMIPFAFIAGLILGSIFRAMFGRLLGAIVTGGLVGVIAWFLVGALAVSVVTAIIAFFLTLVSDSVGSLGGGRGGWSGGSGGGFSGGSGGGFSGGGGSFGGGGASGRW